MKKITSEIQYEVYDSLAELPGQDRMLLQEAIKATENAYAPYSGFRVGAAVLMENGEVIIGSNQENAVYPSGLCAERVALFAASAKFPGVKIKSIGVAASSVKQGIIQPVSPCGECRQVMVEYEHRYQSGIKLIITGSAGSVVVIPNAGMLLPFLFNADSLRKK